MDNVDKYLDSLQALLHDDADMFDKEFIRRVQVEKNRLEGMRESNDSEVCEYGHHLYPADNVNHITLELSVTGRQLAQVSLRGLMKPLSTIPGLSVTDIQFHTNDPVKS